MNVNACPGGAVLGADLRARRAGGAPTARSRVGVRAARVGPTTATAAVRRDTPDTTALCVRISLFILLCNC